MQAEWIDPCRLKTGELQEFTWDLEPGLVYNFMYTIRPHELVNTKERETLLPK